jgi:hypothetical protein
MLTRGKSSNKESMKERKLDLSNRKRESGYSSEVSPRRMRAFAHSERNEQVETVTVMEAYLAGYSSSARH